jgi:polyphosphate kinase
VELAVPIESEEARAELLDALQRAFADNQNSWVLHDDSSWSRRTPGPGEEPRSLQLELAARWGAASGERAAGEPERTTQHAYAESPQL